MLAQAEHLAATVAMGFHGRRRAGHGENFWQYRQAVPGDPRSAVDWRRSGKSDQQFIREMEWEAAQTVSIWVDDSLVDGLPRRRALPGALQGRARGAPRPRGLGAADQGRRAGGADGHRRGASRAPGRAQLNRMALALGSDRPDDRPDYGVPPNDRMAHGSRAIFFSDFLGDVEAMKPALAHAADQGVRGCFVQVLDESEEVFPFDGRMIFESMGGTTEFETQRARALREAYATRLAERRAKIRDYARHLGWRCLFHHTSHAAAIRPALALHGGGRTGVTA